jgi:uncharacterized protein (TIGR01370 family)
VRRALAASALLATAALIACTSAPETVVPNSLPTTDSAPSASSDARGRMSGIEDFVVYYGSGELRALSRFDLAIIDPATLSSDDIATLRSRGTIVVGYLSVGEIAGNDPWLVDGTVPKSWILGRNKNWGSLFVDASQPGWQELMRGQMGDLLTDYGFDGVFLDTVDTAVDVAPETGPGMVALIEGLREAYPEAVLIQNRGFELAPRTAGAIDGLMFEDLSTTFDFDRYEYERVRPDRGTVASLMDLHERTSMPILALDYADTGDRATARRAVRVARSYGFVPAVSVIGLDEIPDYGLG